MSQRSIGSPKNKKINQNSNDFYEMENEGEPLIPQGGLIRDGMSLINIAAYGVAHVYNDFWATLWFMYLLYFLTYPVGLGPGNASLALLSGQIADGLATNIVGLMIDKTNTRIGKNKPWYIFGFVLVLPTFILTFNTWVLCDLFWNKDGYDKPTCKGLEMAYFIILPALFNIGWAAVQISTMAIVVSLSLSQGRRDRLVSLRNGFTYASNLFALVVAIIFILLVSSQIWTFRLLAWTLTAIGVPLWLIFVFFVPEVRLAKEAISYDKEYRKVNGEKEDNTGEEGSESEEHSGESSDKAEGQKTWKDWLKSGAFYVHAIVYTFTRMAVNVTMTLTPFYLIHVLGFESEKDEPAPPQIATVPLVSYTWSMIFSLLFYNRLVSAFGNRLHPLFIGTVLVVGSSIPFFFMKQSFSWLVYVTVGFQGVGLAIMLNIATSLISDVIGNDDQSSAFVYGTYSLCDKFVNGFLLVAIGNSVIEDPTWLRWLSSGLPLVSSIATFLFAMIGKIYYADKMRKVSVKNRK